MSVLDKPATSNLRQMVRSGFRRLRKDGKDMNNIAAYEDDKEALEEANKLWPEGYNFHDPCQWQKLCQREINGEETGIKMRRGRGGVS